MKYKLREDVILENLCGVHLLIALRPAWKEYPFAIQISEKSALMWDGLRNSISKEEILKSMQSQYDIEDERAEWLYDRFVSACIKRHYLQPEDSL